MDATHIARALVHPPVWDPDANEFGFEAARVHPDRFGLMAWFDLADPASRTLIRRWRGRPGLLGLRFTFIELHQKTWLADGTMDWLWTAAEKAGLPVAVSTSTALGAVAAVAERHPALRLIVDHMAVVRGVKDAAAFAKMPELVALAAYSNVAVKATGGPGYVTDGYPFSSLRQYYRRIYDAFGPHRMFWGADKTRMPCSWAECVMHFVDQPWLPERDKELVMGEALCRWLNWPLPGEIGAL
jgi:predicted TIM-barrel fold metal-dependent hydrolase